MAGFRFGDLGDLKRNEVSTIVKCLIAQRGDLLMARAQAVGMLNREVDITTIKGVAAKFKDQISKKSESLDRTLKSTEYFYRENRIALLQKLLYTPSEGGELTLTEKELNLRILQQIQAEIDGGNISQDDES